MRQLIYGIIRDDHGLTPYSTSTQLDDQVVKEIYLMCPREANQLKGGK